MGDTYATAVAVEVIAPESAVAIERGRPTLPEDRLVSSVALY